MTNSATTEVPTDASNGGSKPVFSSRSGSIRGSVFCDDVTKQDGTTFSKYRTSIQRFYKRKDNEDWEYTNSFGEDDLFDVMLVAQETYKFIKSDRAGAKN